MLIGILSDAHGNPYGFSACVHRLLEEGVERIYFLGDSVGYMPDVAPILERLEHLDAVCLRGNHEEMLLGRQPLSPHRERVYRLQEAAGQLAKEQRAYIEGWHGSMKQEVLSGRQVAFCHGSPWEPVDGYVYPDSDLTRFMELPYQFVFMGHTHRPFQRRVGQVQVVNVGSCGLPRDVGNMASCALFDSEEASVRILRLPFDVEQVIMAYGPFIHPAVIDCLRRTDLTEATHPGWPGRAD